MVKYMNVVEDMYEDSETVVSCVVEVTDGLKLRVGLTHRFSSEPFLVFNDDEQDLCLQTTLCSIVRAGGRMPGEVVVCIALAKVRAQGGRGRAEDPQEQLRLSGVEKKLERQSF